MPRFPISDAGFLACFLLIVGRTEVLALRFCFVSNPVSLRFSFPAYREETGNEWTDTA